MSTTHTVIIGNGIAGTTVARNIRKRSTSARITIISGETPHFYSRTALMYIYMGHLTYNDTKPYEDFFWSKNRIDLVQGWVQRIDTAENRVHLESGSTLEYNNLVIATGSRWKSFGWKGQDLRGVQGLYSMQDLELMQTNTEGIQRAVVVGGGLIGIEVAEMLHSRGIHVTFLVRELHYWNRVLPNTEAVMITQHIRDSGIDFRPMTELSEIVGDSNGRVRSILTTTGEEIPCEFLALTVGVEPSIDVVRSSGIPAERGVVVNEYLETAIPNVFAAGDCVEIVDESGAKSLEQLWYTGKMHGEVLAATLTGTRTKYERGILFNSAKLFDIEYQTYGLVNFDIPNEQNLVWQDSSGKRCIRIVYTPEGVIGFNLLGVRYRHRVCEAWIREKRSIEYVLENLGAANFDPEFFEQCEANLVAEYNRQNPHKTLHLRRMRRLLRGVNIF
jgi:3-phenylpropionate/trans-cinnamate dioxygenase ferredoxin reductase component